MSFEKTCLQSVECHLSSELLDVDVFGLGEPFDGPVYNLKTRDQTRLYYIVIDADQ